MTAVRALVCGGRDYADEDAVWRELGQLSIAVLAHGGARGADRLADYWASVHGVPVHEYRADWGEHGKAAGVIRNQRMLDEFKPDLVIAFPGGRGTADMVRRAEAAGVQIILVN